MTDDDPRGRLERALDRAPVIADEVDSLWLDFRQDGAERTLAARALPDIMVTAIARLNAEDRDTLADVRLIVAALEPAYLHPLDMTFLRAVAAGRLPEAVDVIRFLMRSSERVSRAVSTFSDEYAELLDVAS